MLGRPQISRPRMALEVLCPRGPSTQTAQLAARLRIAHFLVRRSAQGLAYPEASSEFGRFARGQDVARSDALYPVSVPADLETRVPPRLTLSPYDTQVFSPRKRAP